MLAFFIGQVVKGTESPAQFLTSVDQVEKKTGLDFFRKLPDGIEEALESKAATGFWQ
jgi:endonuclease G